MLVLTKVLVTAEMVPEENDMLMVEVLALQLVEEPLHDRDRRAIVGERKYIAYTREIQST